MNETHRHALKLIKEDNWDAAHRLIQDFSDPLSCQIHGLLHRVQGDLGNARYWYHRADLRLPNITPEEELEQLFIQLTD